MTTVRYITIAEVYEVHRRIVAGGNCRDGVPAPDRVDSAVGMPQQGFGRAEHFSTLPEKAAALAYYLVRGHGFADGNKRVGHQCMQLFLALNGAHLVAPVDEATEIFNTLADGNMTVRELTEWVEAHVDILPPEIDKQYRP